MASYLVATVTLAIAVASVLALRASNQWVERRHAVLIPATTQADRLSLALLDQQNGSRGFILSNNPAFLDSYTGGRARERVAMVELRRLLGDDVEVNAALDRIATLATDWHDTVAAPQIALVEQGRRDDAVRIVESGIGKRKFDAVRVELDDLTASLDARLEAGGVRLERRVAILGALAVAGATIAGLAATGIAVALRRGLTIPLERLSGEAASVAGGHLDTAITASGPIEVDSVARSVEQMRRMLLAEISASFNKGVVVAEQHERARIAGELHDDPIQALSAAQWRLEATMAHVDGTPRSSLETVSASLSEVQMRLRDLMFELCPPSLEAAGLTVALEDLLDETFSDTTVVTRLDSDVDERLDPVIASLAYRLAAEAVRNARRHATPRHVTVTARVDDGVRVSITDDGEGFEGSVPTRPGHAGTQIGPALAAAAGGWWDVVSRTRQSHPHDHGTAVSFWLPLPSPS